MRRRFCFPAGGLLSPSLDGGLPLLVLFRPSRRSSSSSRAARDSTKSISSSFRQEGKGFTIHWILESHHPLLVNQNLGIQSIKPTKSARPSYPAARPSATWAVTFPFNQLLERPSRAITNTQHIANIDKPAVIGVALERAPGRLLKREINQMYIRRIADREVREGAFGRMS